MFLCCVIEEMVSSIQALEWIPQTIHYKWWKPDYIYSVLIARILVRSTMHGFRILCFKVVCMWL